MKTEENVTITKERYEELLNSEKFLICLEDAGVDNWSGYYFAHNLFNEYEDLE